MFLTLFKLDQVSFATIVMLHGKKLLLWAGLFKVWLSLPRIQRKLLRIPTGVSPTFWLLHNAVKELYSGPPRINSNSDRVENLNHGPPDFKSSALNNSATLPFFKYAREITQSISIHEQMNVLFMALYIRYITGLICAMIIGMQWVQRGEANIVLSMHCFCKVNNNFKTLIGHI